MMADINNQMFVKFKTMVDSLVYNSNKEEGLATLKSILDDCETELTITELKRQLLIKELNYTKHLMDKVQ
ncbi:MAG: hypothetical protein P5702_25480 [Limnospira sp. PMC 1291.21]|uniref:Uncharacterized protein n=2 Tax=Limnospira TaxID=2596745 RepID=B5VXS5_LIMMA|nr:MULTISPECIES: hypothetical protein [unclassified Limnospira]EDZ93116.1 hypothetical protein AmaxDRAFT_4167 [Limnospira maxima CS-328]MBD2671973.1 hypothetical protein [Arthrospira platensis FACHB-439]EDZ93426.1 hypothetical protein AmaxDRAFT_3814 [Limnospira maxima CS-328]EDZ95922.1 hypothetical protein AmaxDRAFT_1317 [Limnospira maxima CS-328]MDT9181083.1 hypothetical protein [Limnospira sp. PMC 1238.20]